MRKAFTLIEMLTTIGIIAILGSMIGWSALEAVSTGDANTILNNMQQIKTATLMWYKQNSHRLIALSDGDYKIRSANQSTEQYFSDFIKDYGGSQEILKYIDKSNAIKLRSKKDSENNTGDYMLIAIDKTTKWYVCCNLGTMDLIKKGAEAPDARVREKIAGRAESLNLFGIDDKDAKSMQGTYTSDKRFVCMLILDLNK